MKSLKYVFGVVVVSVACALTITSCATTGKYDDKVQSWEGKDSASLIRSWGEPEAKEKLRNGDFVFVYSRLHHEPLAYGASAQKGREIASAPTVGSTPTSPAPIYIKCTTYFTVNPQGKITYVMYRGDECKSSD